MSNGLGIYSSRPQPVIYRWADGSEVLLTVQGSWNDMENQNILVFAFMVRWSDPYAVSVNFKVSLNESKPVLYLPVDDMKYIDSVDQRKLLGFILDLGVDRFFDTHTGLVTTHVGHRPSVVLYPRFIPNETWDNRYEQALKHVVSSFSELKLYTRSHGEAFPVNYLKFRSPKARSEPEWWRQSTWAYRWYSNGVQIEREAASLEQAVDDVLQTESILPESAKESWDKENVEHGAFVLPTPEEVEVFRILDEPLPFFLHWKSVEAWLQASGIWP